LEPVLSARVSRVKIGVNGQFGERLALVDSDHDPGYAGHCDAVRECRIPELPLPPGRYSLEIAAGGHHETLDAITTGVYLQVEAGDFFRTGRLPRADQGRFLIRSRWQ
jgi:hypothetical protein